MGERHAGDSGCARGCIADNGIPGTCNSRANARTDRCGYCRCDRRSPAGVTRKWRTGFSRRALCQPANRGISLASAAAGQTMVGRTFGHCARTGLHAACRSRHDRRQFWRGQWRVGGGLPVSDDHCARECQRSAGAGLAPGHPHSDLNLTTKFTVRSKKNCGGERRGTARSCARRPPRESGVEIRVRVWP